MTAVQYRESRPPEALSHLVRCIWTLEGERSAALPEPMISDGSVEIILNGGTAVLEKRGPDDQSTRQPAGAIIGPTMAPVFISPAGPLKLTGIRLWPWAAKAVLGIPASELRDRTVGLGDVRMPGIQILDRLDWRHGFEMRVPVIAAWLAAVRDRRAHTVVRELVERIETSRAPELVGSFAREAGVSWKHLERLCAREAGLGPKELIRIRRVQVAMALSRARSDWTWSTIAQRAGYYDQPHLVREFQRIAGTSPKTFRAKNNSLTQLVQQR